MTIQNMTNLVGPTPTESLQEPAFSQKPTIWDGAIAQVDPDARLLVPSNPPMGNAQGSSNVYTGSEGGAPGLPSPPKTQDTHFRITNESQAPQQQSVQRPVRQIATVPVERVLLPNLIQAGTRVSDLVTLSMHEGTPLAAVHIPLQNPNDPGRQAAAYRVTGDMLGVMQYLTTLKDQGYISANTHNDFIRVIATEHKQLTDQASIRQ